MPSDDLTDYLAALQSATTQQKTAEAQQRDQKLAYAREFAALKAQERAEEERLLKLRIQAAQAEQAVQEALHRREAAAHAAAQRERAEKQMQEEKEKAERRQREEAVRREAEQKRAAAAAQEQAKQRQRDEAARREAEQQRQAAEQAQRQTEQQRLGWVEKHACQWDETPDEYARRLTALGLVEVGRFTFQATDYDVITGYFSLPEQIKWHSIIPPDCRPAGGLLWKVPDRDAARAAVAAGEIALLDSLAPRGKSIGIKDFAIHVAQMPHVLLDGQTERLRLTLDEILAAMVKIKPGKVNPKTSKEVRVDESYALCRFPVKQSWYQAIIGANPSRFQGPNRPVEQVSWFDAVAFCEKLNALATRYGKALAGKSFALPTEAQWEYACRAGSTGDFGLLASGNEGTADQMARHEYNSNHQTHDVGQKEPNAWDLYDMHGNVSEWCGDCREDGGRAIRGGCYGSKPGKCSASAHMGPNPDLRSCNLGFRVSHRSI